MLNAHAGMPFVYHDERPYILVDDASSYIYHQSGKQKRNLLPTKGIFGTKHFKWPRTKTIVSQS